MAGRPPAVTDYEIISAVAQTLATFGDPVVTTGEIVENVPIKREGLGQRLNDLANYGVIERKQVGRSYVWWVPEEMKLIIDTVERTQSDDHDPSNHAIEQQLQTVFDIGRNQFGLELGAVARVDPDADYFQIEHASGRYDGFEPGTELPLSETYCTTATEAGGLASVTEPADLDIEDRTVCTEVGLQTYLGTLIELEGGESRTFFFVSSEQHQDAFSTDEHAFHGLLGQGVKRILEQAHSEPTQA